MFCAASCLSCGGGRMGRNNRRVPSVYSTLFSTTFNLSWYLQAFPYVSQKRDLRLRTVLKRKARYLFFFLMLFICVAILLCSHHLKFVIIKMKISLLVL